MPLENTRQETLTENEIRPDYLLKEQVKRFAKDVRRILRYRNEFKFVPCPACDSVISRKKFTKYGFGYVECLRCETVYVNPRPTPKILEKYYASSQNYAYWNKYIFPVSEKARRKNILKPRARNIEVICKRHGIKTNILLDIGAGFGTFCEEIKKIDIFKRVIAIEPTPDLAKTCRGKGIEVIEDYVENVNFNRNKIDVITCFEVIEHLFCPRAFIKRCASLLNEEGLLVITCPNIKGFDILVLGKKSGAIDTEHLNYFHPSSLSKLVSDCGFNILEIFTPGKLDAELVRKKALADDFDLSKQPFLRQLLINDWERLGEKFQCFLSDNMLSSHMWIVAQKKARSLQKK